MHVITTCVLLTLIYRHCSQTHVHTRYIFIKHTEEPLTVQDRNSKYSLLLMTYAEGTRSLIIKQTEKAGAAENNKVC